MRPEFGPRREPHALRVIIVPWKDDTFGAGEAVALGIRFEPRRDNFRIVGYSYPGIISELAPHSGAIPREAMISLGGLLSV
jgi:hypothetical protein